MGYMGKILRVDLTRARIAFEPLDAKTRRDFIGGRGIGIRYLLEEVDPRCDPLGPENKLLMMTGPLTGTTAPTGGRYMVMTKSPLTGWDLQRERSVNWTGCSPPTTVSGAGMRREGLSRED